MVGKYIVGPERAGERNRSMSAIGPKRTFSPLDPYWSLGYKYIRLLMIQGYQRAGRPRPDLPPFTVQLAPVLAAFDFAEADVTDTSQIRMSGLSRRSVLLRSAACAAGTTALLGTVRDAAAKMAQSGVAYQDSPKGDQQCNNCSLFQAPSSCTLVDGTISPTGWCKFWVKKP
jgi:High potential iron-sulfur protein